MDEIRAGTERKSKPVIIKTFGQDEYLDRDRMMSLASNEMNQSNFMHEVDFGQDEHEIEEDIMNNKAEHIVRKSMNLLDMQAGLSNTEGNSGRNTNARSSRITGKDVQFLLPENRKHEKSYHFLGDMIIIR